MGYRIRPDYVENPEPVYFLDDPKSTPSGNPVTFQPDVYTMAELLLDSLMDAGDAIVADDPVLLDVGCGWGEKLAEIHERHPHWRIVGMDHGANLAHCEATYPWGQWISIDLDAAETLRFDVDGPAVVVCSDVIEHLADPSRLVRALADAQCAYVVISTPEREVQYGPDHAGPPPNLCHVREWSTAELHAYLTESGLRIRWHGLTRGSDQGWAMATQIVIAEGRREW